MPAADRDRLLRWASCGARGEPDPTDPCLQPLAQPGGDLRADACAEASGLIVTGDAVIRDAGAWDCVCEVQGSLAIEAPGAVAFARLVRVGETLHVGGATTELHLPSLREVGGSLTILEANSLLAADVGSLSAIGQDLRLEVVRSLAAFEPLRLGQVGGHLHLLDLSLRDLDGFASLAQVGGDLRIERSRSPQVRGFPRLASVGGSLVVRDDPGTQLIDAFPALLTVGGDLRVEDEPRLLRVAAWGQLRSVGGALVLARLEGLRELEGLSGLQQVGSLALEDMPRLSTAPLPALVLAEGGVRADRTGLQALDLPALDGPGGIQLTDSADLATLNLTDLTRIEGDLRLTGLPSLLPGDVDALLERVEVEGQVFRD
jgi:hypothetical protein